MPLKSPLIVIPTYNEAENLAPLCESILDFSAGFSILVVDDASPDGTGHIADQLSQKYPGRLRVLHRPVKLGLGPAYRAAFAEALLGPAEAILQMDADFSHPVSLLPTLLSLLEHHDFAIASRYVPGGGVKNWAWSRRWLSRGANLFAKNALGLGISDLTSGFKAFRREVLEYLQRDPFDSKGYFFQIETSARTIAAGFKFVEVPFVFQERTKGASKLSGNLIGEAFWKTLRLRRVLSQAPQRPVSGCDRGQGRV